MKKAFIKSISATAMLPFAARAKTEAALVDAHTPESHITVSKIKLKLVSAIALVLVGVAALIILPARATPQAGVSSVTIAHGTFEEIDVFAKTDIDPGNPTDYWKAMINTKGASHLYVLQNTVAPGGSFGWHSHTGPSLIIVMSGVATEYEGNDPTCTPRVHPAGYDIRRFRRSHRTPGTKRRQCQPRGNCRQARSGRCPAADRLAEPRLLPKSKLRMRN